MSREQLCRFCTIVPDKPYPKVNSLTQQLLQFNYGEEFYFYFTRSINEIVKGSRSVDNITFEEVLADLSRPRLQWRQFKNPLVKPALKASIQKCYQREQNGETLTLPNLILHSASYKTILRGLSKKLAGQHPHIRPQFSSHMSDTQQPAKPKGQFPLRQRSYFGATLGTHSRNLFVDQGSFETKSHDIYSPDYSSRVENPDDHPIRQLHKQLTRTCGSAESSADAQVRIEEADARPARAHSDYFHAGEPTHIKTEHTDDQRVIKESFLLEWTDDFKQARGQIERKSATQMSFEIVREHSTANQVFKPQDSERELSIKPKKPKIDLRLDLRHIVAGSSADLTRQESGHRAVQYVRSLSGKRGFEDHKELKKVHSGRSRTASKTKSGVKSQRAGGISSHANKIKTEKSKVKFCHEENSSRDAHMQSSSHHISLLRKLSTTNLLASKDSLDFKAVLGRRLTSLQVERHTSPPLSETRSFLKRAAKIASKPIQTVTYKQKETEDASLTGGWRIPGSDKETSLRKQRSPSHKSKTKKSTAQASLKSLSRKVSLHEIKSSAVASLTHRKGSLVLSKQNQPNAVPITLLKKMSVPFLHKESSPREHHKSEKLGIEVAKDTKAKRPYLATDMDAGQGKLHYLNSISTKVGFDMPWAAEIRKALKHPTTKSTRQLLTQPSTTSVTNPDLATHRTSAASNVPVKYASYAGYQKPPSKIPKTATLADALSILSRKPCPVKDTPSDLKVPFNISPSQLAATSKNLKASFENFPSARIMAGSELLIGALGGEESKSGPWTASRKQLKDIQLLSTIYPPGTALSVTPQKPDSNLSKKEHSSEATRTSSGLPGNSQHLLATQASGDWSSNNFMGMPRSHFPLGPKRSIPAVSSNPRSSARPVLEDFRVDKLHSAMDDNIASSRSKPEDGCGQAPGSAKDSEPRTRVGTSSKGPVRAEFLSSKKPSSSQKASGNIPEAKSKAKQPLSLKRPAIAVAAAAGAKPAAKSQSKKRKTG